MWEYKNLLSLYFNNMKQLYILDQILDVKLVFAWNTPTIKNTSNATLKQFDIDNQNDTFVTNAMLLEKQKKNSELNK